LEPVASAAVQLPVSYFHSEHCEVKFYLVTVRMKTLTPS
jgi:hypothetical protein